MDLTHAKLQLERGQIDDAAGTFMQALTEDFNNPEALFLLGSCFLAKEQYGSAANFFKQCLDIEKMPEAFQNLGGCYKGVNKPELAQQIWEIGLPLAKSPRMQAQFLGNIGGCYVNNGTPAQALDYYKQALEIDPTNLSLQFNKCWPELESGDWANGFKSYDLGFQSGDRAWRSYEGVKQYKFTGRYEVKGKTVIVWGDQGIGDEIMFASCINDLKKDAKKVIFDCHPRLEKLFTQSFFIECHGTRKTQQMDWHLSSDADVSIPISSLATLYRSDGAFPKTKYLHSNEPVHGRGTPPKIGIAWAGGTARTRSDLRSVTLDTLEPILRKKANWHSVQYTKNATDELAKFEEKSGIHIKHYPGKVQCDDYATTAAFVAGLDLVITVCTSIVHLCGALGVECWCLTPSKPAWRYGCEGDQMPWYDSVRLFRQQDGEDWSAVVTRVKEALDVYLDQ